MARGGYGEAAVVRSEVGGAPADVAAIFDRVPSLAGSPRSVRELPGGLTNRNYKVCTPDGTFVARIWSDGDLLAINRDHEHHNSLAAAAAGVGAPVVAYRPADNLLVLGYIDGRTLSDEDVRAPENIPRIARACRRLHAGPRFAGDFDMFDVQRRYLAVAREHGLRIPAGYTDLEPAVQAARRALAVRAGHTVPSNNDLLAANFIDDGSQIWLIDYEYSGNNDPCFELGNIWSECGLPDEALAELVTEYYGKALRNKIARARVLGLIAKYGWTLWGSIQAATSPLDVDFWAWATERYEGAMAGMSGRQFSRLLDDAAAAD
ncbi:MAG TPA: choline/ethanolamine kinase family protein [Streptosporangiaceae bacterium]|nr:choline/ethanolamine kinase family protein [Streptosporangiaceae bacterium]